MSVVAGVELPNKAKGDRTQISWIGCRPWPKTPIEQSLTDLPFDSKPDSFFRRFVCGGHFEKLKAFANPIPKIDTESTILVASILHILGL